MTHRPDSSPPETLAQRLATIEDEIQAACRRSGRPRSSVGLMAVTKNHSTAAILDAAALGISLFGENRVQEFQRKASEIAALGYRLENESPRATGGKLFPGHFHLIGHLQSNKAARAAELFSAIDTLDSLRLALRLNEAAAGADRRLPVLLEIKLSPEESKSGIASGSPAFSELLERIPDLPALDLRGLMTVPPFAEDPAAARPYFRDLSRLREELAAAHPRLHLEELSMGMSHDFALAIEEGATQIRIGTALFGRRPPAA
ncbi:MAG TPA: YggS family pyridoxal phosphate-dependent enzyme [Acidobacteriaceae bacterium]|jgi:hypothetical protein|nr:YggS family pyridoxal phosphate-dependent enzyme [Acidobacteriaceae bacterium]